jgi:hypothetical protein
MVMVLKGTGFDNFRFQTYADEASSILYITDLVGIDGYEYQLTDLSADGYHYLVIDLLASGLHLNPQGLHLHLNNAKIYLHSIFFADTLEEKELSETALATMTPAVPYEIDATASGYVYNYIGFDKATYADYLVLTVTGNVSSLRVQFISHDESVTSGFFFLKDFIGMNGVPLYFQANTTEPQILIIDLKASGIEQSIGAMHVHYGDDDPTVDDVMSFGNIQLFNEEGKVAELESESLETYEPVSGTTIDASAAGYVYTYVGLDNAVLADVMELVVNGNASSLRFQFINNDESVTSATYFLADLIGVDGNPLIYKASTEGNQTLLIDLKASGITQNIKAFHVHYGDGDPTADDVITVHSIKFYNETENNIDLTSANEVYAPATALEISAAAAGYVYNYLGLGTALTTERFLEITVQGNVSSLRIQGISVGETFTSATLFLTDLIGVDGNPLAFIPNTTEPQTLIIDLYLSGLGFDINAFHVHYGDDEPTVDDVLSFISIKAYMEVDYFATLDAVIGE